MIIFILMGLILSGCMIHPAGQRDGSTFRHSYAIRSIAQQHLPKVGPWYFVAAEYNLPYTFRFSSQDSCMRYREMISPVVGVHSLGRCMHGDPIFPHDYERLP